MNIGVVGAGKLGVKVCQSLIGGGHNISLVDVDEAKLEKIGQHLDIMPINDDGRNIGVLKEIGAGGFDYLLAVTGSDEANMTIASFAKKLGCKTVIARVREPEYMKHFDFIKETLDIDFIVNPDFAITMEIYKYLAEKYTINNGIFTSGEVGLTEFQAYRFPKLVNLSIEDFRRLLPDMIIGAISRNGKVIIPHGGEIIQKNDFLYVVGKKDEIITLNKKVHTSQKYTDLQKVMIVGGGKTGYYLAEKLSEFGASVKLIEKNKDRCKYLSTHTKNVMILHGDGTDMTILDEENVEDMDAFVTATGYDEENLLLALTAKNRGVEDVISKVSRSSYTDLISDMGVDVVLNPLDITAGFIFCIIQEEKRVISSMLIQGQAEIIEIIPNKGMKMVGASLKNLNLPKDIIIAAIHRGNQVIIPDGDTKIMLDDRVLMICSLRDIGVLERLMKSGK